MALNFPIAFLQSHKNSVVNPVEVIKKPRKPRKPKQKKS